MQINHIEIICGENNPHEIVEISILATTWIFNVNMEAAVRKKKKEKKKQVTAPEKNQPNT